MPETGKFAEKLYIIDMSNYNRKYPKVTGWWVYAHLTPDYQFIYPGYSGGKDGNKQCCCRWQPNNYKGTSLEPYIEQYGWDNLIHVVIQDGLTEEQAEIIEGALIKQAKADGWCINKQNSGGEAKNNPNEYKRTWALNNLDKSRKQKRDSAKRNYIKTENKIYVRVKNYNRNHTPIETPLEAKNKYLEYGYIPSYIKCDDLL